MTLANLAVDMVMIAMMMALVVEVDVMAVDATTMIVATAVVTIEEADTMIVEVTIPTKVLPFAQNISYKWRTMFSFAVQRNSANISQEIAMTDMHPELTVMPEAEMIVMSAVGVAEVTVIATTVATLGQAAPARLLHPLPPMVIQLLAQSLENLMVAATLMRNIPVESSDC
jgi:hypothetical protein